MRAFAAWGATELPRPAALRVDGVVLAFTAGLSIIAGLAFGLFPALRASTNLEHSLRAGARGAVGGTGQRLRSALVVVEVALAVVLVAGAALAAKSLVRLLAVDPGFRTSNALVVTISVPSAAALRRDARCHRRHTRRRGRRFDPRSARSRVRVNRCGRVLRAARARQAAMR